MIDHYTPAMITARIQRARRSMTYATGEATRQRHHLELLAWVDRLIEVKAGQVWTLHGVVNLDGLDDCDRRLVGIRDGIARRELEM